MKSKRATVRCSECSDGRIDLSVDSENLALGGTCGECGLHLRIIGGRAVFEWPVHHGEHVLN